MRVAIHQPEHMPWLGFLDKMARADCYVILDDVQFTKNNFQNRNKIRGRQGDPLWLTVPVRLAGHIDTTIKEMEIAKEQEWRKTYWGKLFQSYGKLDAFQAYKDELYKIIHDDYTKLLDLNLNLIHFLRRAYQINTPMISSSTLTAEGHATTRLINICRALKATEYVSGRGGKSYLDEHQFEEAGIKLTYQDYPESLKEILNRTPGVVLSSIDLLFCEGPEKARRALQ